MFLFVWMISVHTSPTLVSTAAQTVTLNSLGIHHSEPFLSAATWRSMELMDQ